MYSNRVCRPVLACQALHVGQRVDGGAAQQRVDGEFAKALLSCVGWCFLDCLMSSLLRWLGLLFS